MIRTIFWAFVLLLALSFFGISIRSIILSPAGQENFGFVLHWLIVGWDWLVAVIHSLVQAFAGLLGTR